MLKNNARDIKKLAAYLEKYRFSGNIAINEGAKNWRAVKKLVKKDNFYTFGIDEISQKVSARALKAKQVRDILIDASGLSVARFRSKGAGYFDPEKSAVALIRGVEAIKTAAKLKKRMVFSTGHPGAMVGLMEVFAEAAEGWGAKLVKIDRIGERHGNLRLDMIGRVLLPSDNCSAFHTHGGDLLDDVLENQPVDFVVGDHGFVGAALNRGISAVGFYDTDDPAMPLAEYLGLPVIAVPINDNNYNLRSAELGRFLLK